MGDVFLEQLIKRKSTGMDNLKKALILIAGLLLCFVALNFIFVQFVAPIALLLAVGSIYFAWYFMSCLNIEFEYIYTNGEIDVDKIMAKRKRKRLTTVKISAFEEFDKFNLERYKNRKFDVTLDCATSMTDEDTYYAVFHNRENKHCILIFTPNERLLEEIQKIQKRRAHMPPPRVEQ